MAVAVETRVATNQASRPPDRFRALIAVIAGAAPLAPVLIVIGLWLQAGPALSHYGFGFLLGTDGDPVREIFGALPMVIGTIASSFLALALALPVGIAVAVILAE